MNVLRLLIDTNPRLVNLSLLLLRCTVGGILFVVGAGKAFGWFGGMGMAATVQAFTTKMGFPAPLAYINSYAELIGGGLLVLGLLARPAAFAVMINMAVATIVTLPQGLFAAYPLSLFMSALVILLAGPMGYSVDSVLLAPGEPAPEAPTREKAA